jgi:signal transduction histidine kinase
VDDPHAETRHELKNNLTVIQGYAQLLARELAKAAPDPARQASHLLGLHGAIAMMNQAIERCLGVDAPT